MFRDATGARASRARELRAQIAAAREQLAALGAERRRVAGVWRRLGSSLARPRIVIRRRERLAMAATASVLWFFASVHFWPAEPSGHRWRYRETRVNLPSPVGPRIEFAATGWSIEVTPDRRRVRRIWGLDGGEVWALLDGGFFYRGRDGIWMPVRMSDIRTPPPDRERVDSICDRCDGDLRVSHEIAGLVRLEDISGVSRDDIWVVGERGVVLHWDGSGWQVITAPADLLASAGHALPGLGKHLRAVFATERHVWIVSDDGFVLHLDRTRAPFALGGRQPGVNLTSRSARSRR